MRLTVVALLLLFIASMPLINATADYSTTEPMNFTPRNMVNDDDVLPLGLPQHILLSSGNTTFLPFELFKNESYAVLLGGEYIPSLKDLDIQIFDANFTQLETVNTKRGEMTAIPSYQPEIDGIYYFAVKYEPNGNSFAAGTFVIAPLIAAGNRSLTLEPAKSNVTQNSIYTFAVKVSEHSGERLKAKVTVDKDVAAELRLYPFTLADEQKKFDPADLDNGDSYRSDKADKKGENLEASMKLGHRKNDPIPEKWVLVTIQLLFGEGNVAFSISFEDVPEDFERWGIHGAVLLLILLIFALIAVFGERYIR
jgi:hypothetical protein